MVSEGRRETQSLEMKINASNFASLWRREESGERERAAEGGIITIVLSHSSLFLSVSCLKYLTLKKRKSTEFCLKVIIIQHIKYLL